MLDVDQTSWQAAHISWCLFVNTIFAHFLKRLLFKLFHGIFLRLCSIWLLWHFMYIPKTQAYRKTRWNDPFLARKFQREREKISISLTLLLKNFADALNFAPTSQGNKQSKKEWIHFRRNIVSRCNSWIHFAYYASSTKLSRNDFFRGDM